MTFAPKHVSIVRTHMITPTCQVCWPASSCASSIQATARADDRALRNWPRGRARWQGHHWSAQQLGACTVGTHNVVSLAPPAVTSANVLIPPLSRRLQTAVTIDKANS